MLTLSIRYTIDPNKLADFKLYVESEQEPILRSGAARSEYYLPTSFAGATNQAFGLVDFPSLAAYEQYRLALAADPDHKNNATRLERSGAVLVMERSIMQRLEVSA